MNDTPERWLPLPGYEGLYDVSDHGRVRSWHPWRSHPVPRERSQYVRPDGHMGVGLNKNGVQWSAKVHLLVMSAFVGPRPDGMETRHLDGDPANNVLPNLAYGTKSENALDSVRHGTHFARLRGVTHCKRGHEFSDSNTYLSDGKRHCRACRLAWSRAHQNEMRAARLAA